MVIFYAEFVRLIVSIGLVGVGLNLWAVCRR